MMMRNRLIGLAVAIAMTALPALSQNVTSGVVGNVRDASGAAVPGAAVIVINERTGIETKTQTGPDGEYTVPGLPFGQYTVRLEATGFRENLVKGITLLPNRTTRQDFNLEVGNVQQTVEVTATAAVLNTESATIGNIMPAQQITTAPLNGRFLDRLIRISAGVTSDKRFQPSRRG